MKVLFITNMYPVPDYIYFGIHVKEQIDALRKDEGVENDVYFINGRESKLNYFKSIFALRKKIEQGNYDLIHIHYGISGLFLLFYTPKVPVIVTLHSGELFQKKGYINHLMQKNLTMAIVKRVQKVIVLNDTMISLLDQYKDKLVKLPCGTDLELFSNSAEPKRAPHFTIGFPGNKARPEKNHPLFMQIITELRKASTIDIIEFHNLTREEVIAGLGKIDLLLMTSTVEGSPQIIKEAMACNRPIISTNVGDVDDLLAGVANSTVVNNLDFRDFLEPVVKIMNLPASARLSNGREKLIEMGLNSRKVSERIFHLYKETLQQK
ncbi:glycosyltransferase family 4 protein [Pedobacter sp. MC2016-15]|uniref:glycosyltransferase family 4 protein n=1 Tax=Pedobacter sp. MC2016-15 TaxID=2994473 RepID=UPI002245FAE9|nr:glycosyltransferase family 4 protein [Pedobacter sp. MC2016-15]MCX2477728.1 glycosyltransferase family 4 protein [Pedobacter sp. MC2016-15]